MKILHVFDHTLPLHSGYTFRSAAILRNQRKLGWQTWHLSGPKQIDCSVLEEDVDGLHFYRTPKPSGLLARLPGGDPFAVMRAIEKRLLGLARDLQPDVIHAHSPVLDAVPAIRVGASGPSGGDEIAHSGRTPRSITQNERRQPALHPDRALETGR